MDFKQLVQSTLALYANKAIMLIFAAAVVFFMWNILGVIRKSDQPEELAKLKSKVVWGIVAIAVMASMWGLVSFITNSVQLDNRPFKL